MVTDKAEDFEEVKVRCQSKSDRPTLHCEREMNHGGYHWAVKLSGRFTWKRDLEVPVGWIKRVKRSPCGKHGLGYACRRPVGHKGDCKVVVGKRPFTFRGVK